MAEFHIIFICYERLFLLFPSHTKTSNGTNLALGNNLLTSVVNVYIKQNRRHGIACYDRGNIWYGSTK